MEKIIPMVYKFGEVTECPKCGKSIGSAVPMYQAGHFEYILWACICGFRWTSHCKDHKDDGGNS